MFYESKGDITLKVLGWVIPFLALTRPKITSTRSSARPRHHWALPPPAAPWRIWCLRHPPQNLAPLAKAPGRRRMTDDFGSPPPTEQPAAFPRIPGHTKPPRHGLLSDVAQTSIDVSATNLAMLPLSARRVASAAPQASTLLSSSAASHAPRPAAGLAASTRKGLHQRRYSSSKPSPKNRSNGPKDLPTGETVSTSASSGEMKTPSEKRKRKSKAQDAANDPFHGFPSVPSTQHLSQEGTPPPAPLSEPRDALPWHVLTSAALGLSSFFSMHRPISITNSVPRAISDEAFGEIFAARAGAPTAAKPSSNEVISTLSRAVDDLEGPMAKMSISRAEADAAQQPGDGVQKIDLRHADGRESSLSVQVKSMTGQFLPFQPPPIPEPGSASGEAVNAAADQDADLSPERRVYRAMFTIEETLDADGQVQVLAHSPRILDDGQDGAPTRYIDRVRRARHEDALVRRGESMHAISVKKRRKLKMKKKKFKKKLKSSRKLRERLHKL